MRVFRCVQLVLASAAIVTSSSIVTAGIPEPTIPAGVGVNIHFVTGHEKDLDLIAGAGIKFIRMDFAWGGIERKRGEYNWAGYDELLANLETRGLRALFILDYSNDLYEETVTSKNPISGEMQKHTSSPQHPESVAAFARWAAAAAARYRGRDVIWEIWNEPNIQFWAPKPDVKQYITLALATCRALREQDPEATIIAPATSGFPWEFLEAFFRAGALEFLDGVSVHPYRDYRQGPETAGKDYAQLRELIDRYAPAGKKGRLPILSGEWGYATHDKGLSPETQAAFAVRQQLANLLYRVPLSIWYDWKNDGTDKAEREHHFGTVLHDLQPKPAYEALKVFTRELAGYRVAERLPLPDQAEFMVVCTNSTGAKKLVAWTTAQPRSSKLRISAAYAKTLKGMSGKGEVFQPVLTDGQLNLELEALPKYISLGE